MPPTPHGLFRFPWRGAMLAAGAAALVAACNGDGPARRAAPSASEATRPESHASAGSGGADLNEVRNYRLRMDKVERFFDANLRLAAAAKGMDSTEGPDLSDANQSLDEMEAAIARHPQMSAAIRAAGLSPREYAVLSLAYLQAAMAGSIAAQQQLDDQAAAEQMQANAENIRFVREHKADLERMQHSVDAKLGAAR
ncbi:MAG TPA: hypothetical protein VFS11_02430 [Gemmatimonadales bacterium]|nr:hypothetical protein [Gemmatimonadales bacterium]